MSISSFQSIIDSNLSPELKTKIRKFHLWKKKHVGVVVGIALLLLLAVGAGASMILVRTSSDLRQQAMVDPGGGGSDPYAPTQCYYIDIGLSDPNDMECLPDPNSKSSGCEQTGWSNLSLDACQKQLEAVRNPKTNYWSLCYTLKSPSYPSDGCYQLNVSASYPNQPCEQISMGSQKFYTHKADCERITTPTPVQGGGSVCPISGNVCDGKDVYAPCQISSNGLFIKGACVNFGQYSSTPEIVHCSCYYTGSSDPNDISCIGGESYCYGGTEYVCNSNNKGVTKVKTCGILGCDESTGKCKVVPTATPKQITCYWRYPSSAQYCSKTMRTVSYSTQTCEQIGSYLYTNEGDCNGKYAVNPTPTPTVRVPTSTPILFVTNTPVPTSAPIVFVTNTPAPTSAPLPTPTPTIVIQEPVQSIPVCRTTSGLFSRFSWWRNVCAR